MNPQKNQETVPIVQDQNPIEEPVRPFNIDTIDRFRKLSLDCFTRHPELRSIAVTLDMRGNLGEAQIAKALWIGVDAQGRAECTEHHPDGCEGGDHAGAHRHRREAVAL